MIRRLAPIALLALATPAAPAEPFRMISLDDVERMLAAPDVAVYDANRREVYQKHHLPGARFVERSFGPAALPADKATRLVFYCAGPK